MISRDRSRFAWAETQCLCVVRFCHRKTLSAPVFATLCHANIIASSWMWNCGAVMSIRYPDLTLPGPPLLDGMHSELSYLRPLTIMTVFLPFQSSKDAIATFPQQEQKLELPPTFYKTVQESSYQRKSVRCRRSMVSEPARQGSTAAVHTRRATHACRSL